MLRDDSLFNNLIKEVTDLQIHPENHYEIAAILESIGWNDKRARDVFGVSDIFELAYEIFTTLDEDVNYISFDSTSDDTVIRKSIVILKGFIRGAIFALPMALSVLSMLTLRFSLWSYEYLSVEMATCIAIGTIFSFLTVGGFMQAIARSGFLYLRQNYYNLARKITAYYIRLGYLLTAAVAILFFLFNLIFEAFPYDMMLVIIIYYVFLCAIWFTTTVMYILEREFIFSGLLAGGIGLVFVMFVLFKMNIIVSQIIALGIVATIGLFIIFYIFQQNEKKMNKGIEPSLPQKSIILYNSFPYFTYGFLYFAFLFVDRIIGWSTNNSYMPYIIWFRGAYELGLDFALLMLIVPMGACEVVISNLMDELSLSQKNSYGVDAFVIDSKFKKLYFRRMITVGIISLISALFTYFLVWQLELNPPPGFRSGFISNYVTHFVLIVGLISYAVISVALMNCVTLFSLSQPEMASRAILSALVINIIVGFLLSRWITYYFSVFGLLAGAIAFLYLSSKRILKVFSNLDYYLYYQS